jgi:16S rRNA (cytosine967-C5)-methyltransferase
LSEVTKGLAVRQIAVQTLHQVLDKGLLVEEALDGYPATRLLEPRDRAFLHAIVLTSLRHKGEIDHVLGQLLSKPLPRKSGSARWVLHTGAAQLLFLEAAPHAVIDLAVRAARLDSNAQHFTGLINAVLRKLSLGGKALIAGLDPARLSTPDWLWTRWERNYGREIAAGIAAAHMLEPALDISVKSDAILWAGRLGGTLLPTGSIRLGQEHDAVDQLPGFAEGAWWVQDAASALPGLLFGEVSGKSILDLCAAPGGKTMQLSAAGARVTAMDKSPQRLRRLDENLRRVGFTADVIVGDAHECDPSVQYDGVLLDAPCSATGTIRRHPELAYVKDDEIVSRMRADQARLLRRAATVVKPGGTLVYCTCSLEPEEGERQIGSFLRSHPEFALAKIAAGERGIEPHMVTGDGCLRTLPSMPIGRAQGLDGFFAARFVRSGNSALGIH